MGINSPKTMKFIGWLKGKKVMILLDSGVTHNFLSDILVIELEILVSHAKFSTILEDHQKVQKVGRCEKTTLTFQGITIVQNFFPFKLEIVDVILGID